MSMRPGEYVCDPGRRAKDVLLALAVVDARCLHVRIVRHLVVVETKTGVEANLVLGIGIVDERSESSSSMRLVVQVDIGRRFKTPIACCCR